MKKTILTALGLGMAGNFLFGAVVGAQRHNYQLLEKIPGVNIQTGPTQFKQYIEGIYAFGIWTVGVAAMFMIIVGGFMYMTSAGNTSRAEAARRTITNALIGLVAALTAYLILYIINPDFVNITIG